jgi:hypothetical protein
MTSKALDKLDALEIIGFRQTRVEINADDDNTGFCNAYVSGNQTIKEGTSAYQTVEKMIGRIRNVEYMAAAIDQHEGDETIVLSDEDKYGREQFLYLLSDKDMKDQGRFYIILRKFYKTRDLPRLRAGLQLLLGIESGIISYQDAANLVFSIHSVTKDQ